MRPCPGSLARRAQPPVERRRWRACSCQPLRRQEVGGRVGFPRRLALAGARAGQGLIINPSPLQPSPAACSHQCFKRSPCPVPAAVWVLLGKLAMACKLGTLSPPQPALLFHSLSLPKPSPWRLTWMWQATWPLPPCHLHVPTPCDLIRAMSSAPWDEKRPLSLPAWCCLLGFLLGPGPAVSTS